ncbi:DUF4123 domain-containing protein [Duganella sp. FT134W]|uniref:DUF4123 domain-containing protein n=1 Tax=Duganella margarita TaxID=2692170 RepID=A0A7X4KGJ7_9BURK|nr:DUF4123 domain-containing protein [Duganella margarita]MYM72669.1 DUF4123 domain-containing protein [Duganella margarita]
MYFATNPPRLTLPSEIAEEFEQLNEASPLHLFALVDCAFDEAFFNERYQRGLPRQSLYADTGLSALGAAAPHLLSAPEGEEAREEWLRQLFAACEGKPMISIIASVLNAAELVRHLRPYLIARTPDTVEWPVRWGDTRVLPALLDTLDEAQCSHLLSSLARWWSPGRAGELLSWQGASILPLPADFDKLPISDDVFAALVDISEADTILARLYDSQPDLLAAYSPAECHARVMRNLCIANANSIQEAPAREHFSVLALILVDDFTQQPAMGDLLTRMRQGAHYNDEIAALPDTFWQMVER